MVKSAKATWHKPDGPSGSLVVNLMVTVPPMSAASTAYEEFAWMGGPVTTLVAERDPSPLTILQSPMLAPPETVPLRGTSSGSHKMMLDGTATTACFLTVTVMFSTGLTQLAAVALTA